MALKGVQGQQLCRNFRGLEKPVENCSTNVATEGNVITSHFFVMSSPLMLIAIFDLHKMGSIMAMNLLWELN